MTAAATSISTPRDVVFVVASMITGGTQTHLLQVLRHVDRSRFTPHLYCLRDSGDLIETARALDVEVTTYGMRGSLRSPRDLPGLLRMVRDLRALRPAIVHGYLLRGNFFGAVAAKLAGVPVVISSRRGLHRPTGLPEWFAVSLTNRICRVITGNSPAVIDFTRDVEKPRGVEFVMIPSGIDVSRFEPIPDRSLRDALGLGECPVVGTAITFRPRKGFKMLFEALAELRQHVPDVKLLIAGANRFSDEAEALAARLDLSEAIILLGIRDDMPAVLASLDVFVLPSESEGMSNAILEAMATGLPVVATAVGGNPVVIEDGVSGYIVEYEDYKALADRLNRLLSDPTGASEMGSAARRRVVERYSAASMVEQMETLYDRLLDGAASGGD